MFYGSPISNRFQIYSLKYFSYPKSSTCSANLNSGVFGKLIFENTILYYTHGMIIGQKFGARRWSTEGGVIDFKEHMEITERKPTPNKKPNNAKVFVGPNFSCLWKWTCMTCFVLPSCGSGVHKETKGY